jgi:hypothetical protein
MTDRFIDRVVVEFQTWQSEACRDRLPLWLTHPLLKALSPEHIRTSQRRQILAPIVDRLVSHFGSIDRLVPQLRAIVADLQTHHRDLAVAD